MLTENKVESIVDKMFLDMFNYLPTINFAKVRPDAIIPTKRKEDVGYDIYANFEEDFIVLEPHETKLIPTGISSAFSHDFGLILKERGSVGVMGMGVRAGVVDSGFRGEIKVVITNHNNAPLVIAKEGVNLRDVFGEIAPNGTIIYPKHKAICQGILLPVPKVQIKEISYEELQQIPSDRGVGMIGSSRK